MESSECIDSLDESGDCSSLIDLNNSVNYDSTNTNKKLLFSSQTYKKLDEHTIFEIFIFSLKHVFWLFITSAPSIIFVTLAGFGYSQLSWTHLPKMNSNNTNNITIQKIHNHRIIQLFDDVIRCVSLVVLTDIMYEEMNQDVFLKNGIILSLIPVLIVSVMVNKWKYFLKNVIYITVPLSVLPIIFFAIFDHFFDNLWFLWYYYIDDLILEVVFLLSLILASLMLSRTHSIVSFKELMKHLLFPSIMVAFGVGFVDIYLSKTYQIQKDGSWTKYIIRLVVYPLLVDCLIGFSEYNIRKLKFCDTHSRSHVIYVFQVTFGVIARYMTISSGDLKYIALTAFLIGIKDAFLHRMSRFQCCIVFHLRKWLRKCNCIEESAETFEEWFYEEELKSFRANILNSEFVNELTTTFVVPVIVVSFEKHRLLFDFDYSSFFDKNGSIDNNYFLEQEIIQLVFLLLSFVVITMIEAKFNGVDLRVEYKQVSVMQQLSQVIIFFWGMILLLSSVRILPNYFQCSRNDICYCRFLIDKSLYGCDTSE